MLLPRPVGAYAPSPPISSYPQVLKQRLISAFKEMAEWTCAAFTPPLSPSVSMGFHPSEPMPAHRGRPEPSTRRQHACRRSLRPSEGSATTHRAPCGWPPTPVAHATPGPPPPQADRGGGSADADDRAAARPQERHPAVLGVLRLRGCDAARCARAACLPLSGPAILPSHASTRFTAPAPAPTPPHARTGNDDRHTWVSERL